MGWPLQDGIWEISGWARSANGGAAWYMKAAQFPNLGTAFPQPVQDGSTTIETGAIYLDTWSSDLMSWDPNTPRGFMNKLGFGIGGEDWLTPEIFRTHFNGVRNALNYEAVALVLAPIQVPDSNNQFIIGTRDAAADRQPSLTVDWTLNPPAITSGAVLAATVFEAYTYPVVATAWSLGDQTLGNFTTLTYTLDVSPSGMVIDSGTGLITWTPSGFQLGDHSVNLRITNSAGDEDTQNFTVTVADTAFFGVVRGAARGRVAVSGAARGKEASSGAPESSAAVGGLSRSLRP